MGRVQFSLVVHLCFALCFMRVCVCIVLFANATLRTFGEEEGGREVTGFTTDSNSLNCDCDDHKVIQSCQKVSLASLTKSADVWMQFTTWHIRHVERGAQAID